MTGQASDTFGAVFDRAADDYDRSGVPFFSVFGRQLVDEVGITAGERVLDVGCGRGAVLRPAAEAVGPAGHVTGLDLAPRMVELTAADARAAGWDHVDVRVADAADPPLEPASYDVVTASLVVFFLADPVAALSRWRALLRPGGRLGITTFGQRDPRWAWYDDLQREFSPTPPLRPASIERFLEADGVRATVQAAGFVDVRITARTHEVVLADAEQWLTFGRQAGGRAFWDTLPPDRLQAAQDAARRRIEAMAREREGLRSRTEIRYTTARVSVSG